VPCGQSFGAVVPSSQYCPTGQGPLKGLSLAVAPLGVGVMLPPLQWYPAAQNPKN